MTLKFGDFVLDADARLLTRTGKDIRLSPKAFDLLLTLVERRPDVITKADLLSEIWPETYVVEANLNVVVGEIRRALGDDPHAPRFIRTVHAVGYAFCAPAFTVEDTGRGTPVAATSRCWLVWKTRTFALSQGANVIGRDPASQVWLEDESVSRRHARITVAADLVQLEDLESTNGTFLGRQPITSPTALQDGDGVRVGSVKLTFRMPSGGAARTRRLRDKPGSRV